MNINPLESTAELIQTSPSGAIAQSSEQLLLSMYDSVEASIFVVDVLEDGDFRYVGLNPTHERWTGIRKDDLRGKTPEEVLSPVDAANVRQHYSECVRCSKTICYEQCLEFKGIRSWWKTTLTPLRNANSRIYRLIGTSQNISSKAEAEKIDDRREQLLGAIAQKIHFGVELQIILNQTVKEIRQFLESDRVIIYRFQVDLGGIIIAESTIVGGTSLLGTNIKDTCFSEKYIERYKRGGIQVVEDIYAAGLHPCQIDLLASLQVKANVVVPILLKQDLWGLLIVHHCRSPRQWQQTEIDLLKQIATQLGIAVQQTELQQEIALLKKAAQAQVEELEKLKHLKKEFLRSLSHELRTPITSISLAAQTLESVLQQEKVLEIELVPQLFQILENECERESKLINDLLTLTYLEADIEPMTLIAIDLQTWLPSIVEPFRERISCQQQQLSLSIAKELPSLQIDITDLERAIAELLNNACKYTPANEAIAVSAYLKADTVCLSVSNTGVEIPSDELSRIFDPFYRIPKNDPWKYGGTGLGLALVKKMVKHLKATIHVESAANKTTFTIEF